MKKNISVLFVLLMLINVMCSACVLAEDNAEPAGTVVLQNQSNDADLQAAGVKSNKLVMNIHIENADNFLPHNMVFGIYSPDGQFWGAKKIFAADIAADHKIVFDIPEYNLGETLYLKLFSGAEKIQYCFDFYRADDMIPLQTFTYVKDTGERVNGDEFSISATPLSSRRVTAYANGWELYFRNPAKIIDGNCMIPLFEYFEALQRTGAIKLDDNSGRVEINLNSHKVVFFIDGNDMYADNKVTYSDTVPLKINGVVYVPFRFLVEGLGGKMTADVNENGHMNVYASLQPKSTVADTVNARKITSRTDYLVWVSKKDFRVSVFKKNNGSWVEEKSFKCSIGAPSTPTITGEYEYYSKESRWSYPTYYVGPIMRFYNGYALHSTLLRYDGSPADGRLGKMISHGCIRLAPQDIQWMVNNVPLHTKIYITD